MAIVLNQVDERSALRMFREVIPNPRAVTVNYVVASVDPSGLSSGSALTLAATASGLMFRVARKVTLVLTDASGGGGGLAATVEFFGHRFGKPINERVSVTCTSGAATTGTTTLVFDQITSVVVRTVTGAAAGDALTCGISGDGLGLAFPIDKVNDVLSIVKIVSGTEQTPIAISATSVDVANSSFNHGGTITAANDTFVVTYLKTIKFDTPGFGDNGVFA
jgi:hypothetical protein